MAATIQQQPPPTQEQNKSNPQLKRLVYSKYREMLGNYNGKANTIIQSLPSYMVTEDKGFNFDHIEEISTLKRNNGNGNVNDDYNNRHRRNHSNNSSSSSLDLIDKESRCGQNPPACVQNAMMTKDKKPFTYTPSGIDLSQIKSPRMAKRIAHNAQMEGVSNQPKQSPLAAQKNCGGPAPPSPATMAAQAIGMPVQVFPSGPPPPPPQPKGAAGGGPPPPPPPGKNNLAPQQNGGAAVRKSPSPMEKFEPPPMGARPEIKIPPNPMAALRKVPKPKEKNDFWIEEYKKDKSDSPMPSGAIAGGSESLPQQSYNRSPSPSSYQQQEQYRGPSPSRFVQQQPQQFTKPTSSHTSMKPAEAPQQLQHQQQYDPNYSTSSLKTPNINQLSLYDQQQQQQQQQTHNTLRSPGIQQTQQYDLNRDQSPIKSPAISQIQNQYQQQLARSQSPQRNQTAPPVQGRIESPFHTPKDNSNLPRPLSPVPVRANNNQPTTMNNQQSPSQQHPTQYPYGRSNIPTTGSPNVTSPTQKNQQDQQPLTKNTQVGSLYIPPVAPENLAANQQQLQQQQQYNNQGGTLRKGPPPNRWVTPTKDVPDWARQNDTTRQQTPTHQDQSQQYNNAPSSNKWPQQQQQQQPQSQPSEVNQHQQQHQPSNKWQQQPQQQQQPSHLQQHNPGLKLQMNNQPIQSGTHPKERIIPIEIEKTPTSNPSTPGFPGSNSNSSSTPGSAGYQGYQNYPGQQQTPTRIMSPPINTGGYQQQPLNQPAGTRVIPMTVEGQGGGSGGGGGGPFNSNNVRGPVSQQPMVMQNGNYRIFVHDIPLEAEIRYRKSRLSDPRTLQHQNSWGGSTGGVNGPSQSKSFRILQKITSTEDSDDSSNRSSPAVKNNMNGNNIINNNNDHQAQLQRPHYSRQMGPNGTPLTPPTPQSPLILDNEQLKRMQINEQDHLNFMNRVRSQDEDTSKLNGDNFRFRGASLPSKSFNVLHDVLDRKMKEESFDDLYNGGGNIATPSTTTTTTTTDPYISLNNGTPPIMRQPQPPRYAQQPGGYYNDDFSQQQYVHPSEQRVPEPKIYTGSAIPSRSFKLLQQMTTPENAAEMEGSDVEHDQISSNSSNSSPKNDNRDNTENTNNKNNENNHSHNNNNSNNNINNECNNNETNNNNYNNNRIQSSPIPTDPQNYPPYSPYPSPYPPYIGYPPYPPPYQYPPGNLQNGIDMKNWPYPPPPPPYPYYYPYYPPPPPHIPPDYDPQNFNINSFYNSNGNLYGSYDLNPAVRRRRNLARSRNSMNNAIANGWRNSAPPNIIVTQSFDETEEEEHNLELQNQNNSLDSLTLSQQQRGYRASSVITDSNCSKPDIRVRSSSVTPDDTESINAKEIISRFNSLSKSNTNTINNKNSISKLHPSHNNSSSKENCNDSCNDSKRGTREGSVIDELSNKLSEINSSDVNNLNISQTNNKMYAGECHNKLSKSTSQKQIHSKPSSPNLNSSSSNSPVSNFTQSDNETVPAVVKLITKPNESLSSSEEEEESLSETDDSDESSLEEYEEPIIMCSKKSVRDIQAYNTETDEDPTTGNSKILDEDEDLGNETECGVEDPFLNDTFDKYNEKIEDEYQKLINHIDSSNSEDEIQLVFMKDALDDIGEEEEEDTVEALDNDDKTVEELLNSDDETFDEEDLNLVSVRLPLKFSFSRSENDENVTTVEVGASEITDSSSRRSSIVSIPEDSSDSNKQSSRRSNSISAIEETNKKSESKQTSNFNDIKDQLKRISQSFDLDDAEILPDFSEAVSEKVSLKADLEKSMKQNEEQGEKRNDGGRRFSITSISAVDSDDCDVSVTVNLSTVRSSSSISMKSHEFSFRDKSLEPQERKPDLDMTDDEDVSVSFSLNMRNKFLGETYEGNLTNNIAKSDSQASSNDCTDLMHETQDTFVQSHRLPPKKHNASSEAVQTTWEEHSKVTSMLIAKWAYNNCDFDDSEKCNEEILDEDNNENIDFCGSIKTSNTTNIETTLDLSNNIEETQVSEEDANEIDFWANINNHDDDGYHRNPIVHNESKSDFCSTKTVKQDGEIIIEKTVKDIAAIGDSNTKDTILSMPKAGDISADLWTTSEKISQTKNIKKTDKNDNIDFWSAVNNEEESKLVQVTKNESGTDLLCEREYITEKKLFGAISQPDGINDFWKSSQLNKETESRTATLDNTKEIDKIEDNVNESCASCINEKHNEAAIDFWENHSISTAKKNKAEENKTTSKNVDLQYEEVIDFWGEQSCAQANITKEVNEEKLIKNELKETFEINAKERRNSIEEKKSKNKKKKESEYKEVIDFWGNVNNNSNVSESKEVNNLELINKESTEESLLQRRDSVKEKKSKSKKKKKESESEYKEVTDFWANQNYTNSNNVSKEKDGGELSKRELNKLDMIENSYEFNGALESNDKKSKIKKKKKELESDYKNEIDFYSDQSNAIKNKNTIEGKKDVLIKNECNKFEAVGNSQEYHESLDVKEKKSKSKKKPKALETTNEINNVESSRSSLKKDKNSKTLKDEKLIETSDNGVNEDKIDFWQNRNIFEEKTKNYNHKSESVIGAFDLSKSEEYATIEGKVKKSKKSRCKGDILSNKDETLIEPDHINDSAEVKEDKRLLKKSKSHRSKSLVENSMLENHSHSDVMADHWCPPENVEYFGENLITENEKSVTVEESKVEDNEIDFVGAIDYFEKITNNKLNQEANNTESEVIHEVKNNEYIQEIPVENDIDFWGSIGKSNDHDFYSPGNKISHHNIESSHEPFYCNGYEQLTQQENQLDFTKTEDPWQNATTDIKEYDGHDYEETNSNEISDHKEEKEECINNYRKAMNFFKQQSSIQEDDDRSRRGSSTSRHESERSRSTTRYESTERSRSATKHESGRSRSTTRYETERSRRGSSTTGYDVNQTQINPNVSSYELARSGKLQNTTCFDLNELRKRSSQNSTENRFSQDVKRISSEGITAVQGKVTSNANHCNGHNYDYYGHGNDDDECEEIEIEIIHESDKNSATNSRSSSRNAFSKQNSEEIYQTNQDNLYKTSVRDKIMAFETGTVEQVKDTQTLDMQSSTNTSKENSKDNLSRTSSLQRSESEIEEDDSGVTDMSKLISETDTESECFPELRKMSRYERAATHSRLFKLLAEEGIGNEEGEQMTEEEKKIAEEYNFKPSKKKIIHNVSITRRNNPDGIKKAETMSQRRERLSLPLKMSTSIDSDNLSTSNSPMSPATSTTDTNQAAVSDQLVNELVQSLMLKTNGNKFQHLPMEKIQAAAKRVLEEHLDSLENTSLESTPALTPQEFKTDSYSEYYNSWNNNTNVPKTNTSSNTSLGNTSSQTISSKSNAENKLPTGMRRGRSIARCPRIISSKTVNTDLTRISESPDIFRGASMTRSSIERDNDNAFRYVRSNSVTRWGKV